MVIEVDWGSSQFHRCHFSLLTMDGKTNLAEECDHAPVFLFIRSDSRYGTEAFSACRVHGEMWTFKYRGAPKEVRMLW